MHWEFNLKDLTEVVRIQDQTFTPDEIAIFYVIYNENPEVLTTKQMELLERLMVEGTTPSRRQYEMAKMSRGILKDVDLTKVH